MVEAPVQFGTPAPEETLQLLAERLRERNIETIIVEDGEAARAVVLGRVPKGAQVWSARSKTLQDSGLFDALHAPGDYDALRPRAMKMDRKTQMPEIRKLLAAPDYMLGSVQAITEDGLLVTASASSSQLGPYAAGAEKVILVVGSQKIVPNLDAALQRIREYALPWEDAHVRKLGSIGSFVGKILIVEREQFAGRMTVVLFRQPIGI